METKEIMKRWNRLYDEGGRYKEYNHSECYKLIVFSFAESGDVERIELNIDEYRNWRMVKPKIRR